jgi:hypothetical protein
MKEVMINGVTYLPASALAKEFRYTTDYIGQLCRAKKVDAQLIGRSWYVNPLSLTAHKQAKFAKPTSKSATRSFTDTSGNDEVRQVKISRVDVPPVVTKAAARTLGTVDQNFAKRIDWKPLKYEVDEGELLPLVSRTQAPAKIAVDLAESTVIAIKTTTKSTNLVPDELPSVSLKGSVAVTSLDEEYNLPTVVEEAAVVEVDVPLSAEEIKMINFAPLRKQGEAKSKSRTASRELSVRPLSVSGTALADITETAVPTVAAVAGKAAEEMVAVTTSSYRTLELSLATVSVALVVCLALLVFSESSVEATIDSYHFGIDFSTTSLTALASYFSY